MPGEVLIPSVDATQLTGPVLRSQLQTELDQTALGNVAGSTTTPSALTRTQLLTLLSGIAPSSDAATTIGLLKSMDAYSQASSNKGGARLRLRGGIGTRYVTFV